MGDLLKNEQEILDFLSGAGRPLNKVQRVQFTPLDNMVTPSKVYSINKLDQLKLDISAELGRTEVTVREFLALKEGDTIELRKTAGDMVNIYINEQPFAQGEILVVHNLFSVRLSLPGKGQEYLSKEEA